MKKNMMLNKKLIIVALILLSLFMIGTASAATDTDQVNSDVTHKEKVSHKDNVADKNTDTIIKKKSVNTKENKDKISSTPNNNDVLKSTDNGTFTALNNKINTSNEITLENDYTCVDTDNFPDGITINKEITIHGNGKTINANKKNRTLLKPSVK